MHGNNGGTGPFSVKVRTLAGKEYLVEGLAESSTVAELKQAIYKLDENFAPDYQRLLLHGDGVGGGDNDSKTLAECGIDGKEFVHLVRRLRGNSFTENDDNSGEIAGGGVVKASDPNSVTLIVPQGVRGGQLIMFQRPGSTSRMQVRVPAGLTEGARFTVRLPPTNPSSSYGGGAAQQMQYQPRQQQIVPPNPSSGVVMEVACPAGTMPGQQIEVQTNRGRMRVVVPPGVYPGQKFRFRVPG